MDIEELIRALLPAAGGVASYFQERGSGEDLLDFAESSALDPFGQPNREYFQQQLMNLYKDPSSVENTPGYRFAQEQGEKGLNRSLAGRSKYYSTNAPHELMEFNQNLATKTFDRERNKLAELGGAGFKPSSSDVLKAFMEGQNLKDNALGSLLYGGRTSLDALTGGAGGGMAAGGLESILADLMGGGGGDDNGIGGGIGSLMNLFRGPTGSSGLTPMLAGTAMKGVLDSMGGGAGGLTSLLTKDAMGGVLGSMGGGGSGGLGGGLGMLGSIGKSGLSGGLGNVSSMMAGISPALLAGGFAAPLIMMGLNRGPTASSMWSPFMESLRSNRPVTIPEGQPGAGGEGIPYNYNGKTYYIDPDLSVDRANFSNSVPGSYAGIVGDNTNVFGIDKNTGGMNLMKKYDTRPAKEARQMEADASRFGVDTKQKNWTTLVKQSRHEEHSR